MPHDHISTLIVGAGPTGLGAAWRLDALGRSDWCLCEAGATFGGLAGSCVDEEGFTWDFGGHVQHSHYDYFDTLMDDLLGPEGWLSHERQSWIWIQGRFVPYPFQLNLHRLPAADRDECLAGLRAVAGAPSPGPSANFGAWIDATFGAGIARLFMRPYNTKVWACPPEELDWAWIGDRVAVVDLARVLANIAANRDDVSWGPNTRFRFPRRGGTGVVWRTLGERLQRTGAGAVRLGRRLVSLETSRRMAHFEDGTSLEYERMLSTIPLDLLVGMSDRRGPLGAAASGLRHTSTHVFGIALQGAPGAALTGKCWMYFPEPTCPFYRVTVFSHYSPFNVPDADRYWSLMAEVSETDRAGVSVDALREDVARGLVQAGLITSRAQIHHIWHRRLAYGYPLPSLRRDEALGAILPALESSGVYSRGRFGAWKYEVSNQDHSFAQGVELVDRWLTGSAERTLHDAGGVNTPGRGRARHGT